MELGQLIIARRKKLGISQVELAEMSGVSERFVYSLENGKMSVSLEKVLAVTDALGLEQRFELAKEPK
jgi:y4mF family transcriptional regulator